MNEFITQAVRLSLGLVALLAAIDYVRFRGRTRLDITLMLASLGVPVLLAEVNPHQIRWISTLSAVVLIAQPYLLIRLVEDFRPVRRAITSAAIVGMVLSGIAVIVLPNPRPALVTNAIIAYFVLFESYATVEFVLGAKASRGVSRWRHSLAATGSALLAGELVILGILLALNVQGASSLVTGLLPVLTGVCYYFGFVPPEWVRQAWQLPEVRTFLRTVADQPAKERADRLLAELCVTATRATAGLGSVVYLWDESEQLFRAASSDIPQLRSSTLIAEDAPVLSGVWRERRPTIESDVLGPGSRAVAEAGGGVSLLAVPLTTPHRTWGVLAVVERRGALFPADDMALLQVLSEQCAIALDNAALVREQRERAEEEARLAAQLKVANEELEAFAYSVSHDLRAPLRGIDGFSQALQKEYGDTLDERGGHYLDRVRANTQFMGRLIDDLLKLSRVTRADMALDLVDLSEIARDVAAALKQEAPARKAVFHIQDGIEARGDPGLLQIAMENLLSNAWKFTSLGPSATIEFGVDGDDGSRVYFVRDNGIGFDMEYAGKLFSPFQRLHPEEPFDGSGVGLATVQRIIARHGGQVWAQSAAGQGATFYFTLGRGANEW